MSLQPPPLPPPQPPPLPRPVLPIARKRALPPTSTLIPILAIALLAIIAAIAAAHACRDGANLTPDSAVYLAAALRWSHGEGLSTVNAIGPPAPLIHFPPGYPLLVGLFTRLGHDPRFVAAAINTICWPTLVALVGTLAWRITRSPALAVLSAAAMLSINAFYVIHAHAWSEPPFLLLTTLCLAALARARHHRILLWTSLAAFAAALAILTRYAGLALLPVGLLALLVAPRASWPRRLLAMLAFALIALAPSALWSHFHTAAHQSIANRKIAWHPITPDRLREGMTTMATFVVPLPHAPAPIILTTLLATLAALALLARRRDLAPAAAPPPAPALDHTTATPLAARANPPLSATPFALFPPLYLAFLILSICLADPGTPLDDRILAPLLPAAILALAPLLHRAAWRARPVSIRAAVLALMVILLIAHTALPEYPLFTRHAEYTDADAHSSSIIAAVKWLRPDELAYSNQATALYLFTGRLCEQLPDLPEDGSDPDEADIAALRDNLSAGGVIIQWNAVDLAQPTLSSETLAKLFPSTYAQPHNEGTITRIPPRPTTGSPQPR